MVTLLLLSSTPAIGGGQSVASETMNLPRWQCTATGQQGGPDNPSPTSVQIDGRSHDEARAATLAECRDRRLHHCRIERCAKL
jgi:hypothetical protein